MKRLILILAVSSPLLLCNDILAQERANKIEFHAPQVYPEGVAFDNRNNIAYVSSVKTGTIGSVDEKGKYVEVFADNNLKSSFGMKVDEKQNRLWVCVGDPNYSNYKDESTFKKMARVVGIDLASHKKVADIDLSKMVEGKHFLNDLTMDDKGNLYVTDSYSPVIYKIDKAGKAMVWAQSDLFKSQSVGLNGIAYHPGGLIFVAHHSDGCLFVIDVKDLKKISRVTIDTFFPGADGLWVDQQKNLILVQNKGVNKIFKLSSHDNWKTADVMASTPSTELFQNPTTCGWFKGGIYVLNAKLNEIKDHSLKPADMFSIQQVSFK